MGRYKMGPNGGYYDPNDSGPDQFTPTPGQQYPGMPAPQQAQPQQPDNAPPWMKDFPQLPGPHQGPWMPQTIPDDQVPPEWRYDPNRPPHVLTPWSESMPDGSGGSWNPGGHVDANGNPLPDAPLPDMSGWAHKQYPGGMGGPIPPWMQGGNGTIGSLFGGSTLGPFNSSSPTGGWKGGVLPKNGGSLASLSGLGGNVIDALKHRF